MPIPLFCTKHKEENSVSYCTYISFKTCLSQVTLQYLECYLHTLSISDPYVFTALLVSHVFLSSLSSIQFWLRLSLLSNHVSMYPCIHHFFIFFEHPCIHYLCVFSSHVSTICSFLIQHVSTISLCLSKHVSTISVLSNQVSTISKRGSFLHSQFLKNVLSQPSGHS